MAHIERDSIAPNAHEQWLCTAKKDRSQVFHAKTGAPLRHRLDPRSFFVNHGFQAN